MEVFSFENMIKHDHFSDLSVWIGSASTGTSLFGRIQGCVMSVGLFLQQSEFKCLLFLDIYFVSQEITFAQPYLFHRLVPIKWDNLVHVAL